MGINFYEEEKISAVLSVGIEEDEKNNNIKY